MDEGNAVDKLKIKEDEPIFPAINVYENEGYFTVQVAIPGYSAAEVKVEVKEQYLIVEGEPASASTENYLQQEFEVAGFKRVVKLEGVVDRNNITATYSNGMLTIRIPKKG